MTPGAQERATELIAFADGLQAAGSADHARRARRVAHDVLDALRELETERQARRACQERHEQYVAYHHTHCFNRDGTTRSSTEAGAFA